MSTISRTPEVSRVTQDRTVTGKDHNRSLTSPVFLLTVGFLKPQLKLLLSSVVLKSFPFGQQRPSRRETPTDGPCLPFSSASLFSPTPSSQSFFFLTSDSDPFLHLTLVRTTSGLATQTSAASRIKFQLSEGVGPTKESRALRRKKGVRGGEEER